MSETPIKECVDSNKMDNVELRLAPRVEESVASVTERYFEPLFVLDTDEGKTEDYCVLLHSNGIALVTLAPSHPIINKNKTIVKIDFQIESKVSRLDSQVAGKHKRGGQVLKQTSSLCFVECDDGSSYTVLSCVPGKLLEVNTTLVEKPEMLSAHTWDSGYIAVILQQKRQIEHNKSKLCSASDYMVKRRDLIPSRFFVSSDVVTTINSKSLCDEDV